MENFNIKKFHDVVKSLSEYDLLKGLCHDNEKMNPLPSTEKLIKFIDLCRSVLFPGYFANDYITKYNIQYFIGVNVEKMRKLLVSQVHAGLCFCNEVNKTYKNETHQERRARAEKITCDFLTSLPSLQNILATDVIANFNGDPAAEIIDEILYCYPGIKAIINYRIAHKLLELHVPIIPRMITELAHSETGIDIHPGAQIGSSFAMDHGTGIVIGATAIIGSNVKLYQGVTLGAKSFPLDEKGHPIKGIPRHPIIKDNVVIYSNATILGRVTIGKGAVIGGNIWITQDVEENGKRYKGPNCKVDE